MSLCVQIIAFAQLFLIFTRWQRNVNFAEVNTFVHRFWTAVQSLKFRSYGHLLSTMLSYTINCFWRISAIINSVQIFFNILMLTINSIRRKRAWQVFQDSQRSARNCIRNIMCWRGTVRNRSLDDMYISAWLRYNKIYCFVIQICAVYLIFCMGQHKTVFNLLPKVRWPLEL